MEKQEDPTKEGHTREWQDRARIVLDAKEKVQDEASPNQSPLPDGEQVSEGEDVEEKSKNLEKGKDKEDDTSAVY